MLDETYTLEDHEFRSNDPYADAKYQLTTTWLRAAGRTSGTLYHVGCGSGLYNRVAVDLGFRVEAVEPDPVVAELAARTAPTGCTVRNIGLGDVPESDVADVVVMHDVLEHIEDDADAVVHLRRLLRSDGLLVLSVPALPRLFGYHDEQLGHYRRYTKATLRRVIEPQFEIVRLRYFGMSFIPLTWVVSRKLRRPYPTGAVAGRESLVSRAFRLLCDVERRIPLPLGTSLVLEARPRR